MLLCILMSCLSFYAYSYCSNLPGCFLRKPFQFSYPPEGIYNIQIADDIEQKMLAYGDINNDLRTDYVSSNQTHLMVHLWNSDNNHFELAYSVEVQIQVQNIYLYDINSDAMLDIAVWGLNDTTQIIYPIFQKVTNEPKKLSFIVRDLHYQFAKTTHPIVILYKLQASLNIGLLLFDGQNRIILSYDENPRNFTIMPWSRIFKSEENYTNIPFSDPHWNAFLDLTGDCRADLVVTNIQNKIEFWIETNGFFFLKLNYHCIIDTLASLSFADMNYDGGIDMIRSQNNSILINRNKRKINSQDQFCCAQCTTLDFVQPPLEIRHQYSVPKQIIQIADINIDGYPELAFLVRAQHNRPVIFQNNGGNSFSPMANYNEQFAYITQNKQSVSVSFLDILQNGVADIIIVTKDSKYKINALYNGYLYQNFFFIKSFALMGIENNNGTQIYGGTFCWVNYIGNEIKYSCIGQLISTAYTSLQMPYALVGLGRANNYIEQFTFGRNGQSKTWSPIIPNSQLAVYSTPSASDNWTIKVFVLPTESLIYVSIILLIILLIMGSILLYFKIKILMKKQQTRLTEIM